MFVCVCNKNLEPFGSNFPPPPSKKKKGTVTWVVPPPSNSHHQDYYIFCRDPYKPSLATVTGRGDNPNCNHQPERSAPNKTTPFDPQKVTRFKRTTPLGLTLPAGSSGAWPSKADKKTQLMPFFLGGICCCWFTYVYYE